MIIRKLKIRQKNEFIVQLKNGAKVVDEAKRVKGGWYAMCKVWDTLDDAIEAMRDSAEQRACAFGDDVKVTIEFV